MPFSKLAAGAVVGAALVVTSGCGGSSKSGSTESTAGTQAASTTASVPATTPKTTITIATGKPLSHAAWIAKGDAICAVTNTKLSATTAKKTSDFVRLLPQGAIYESTEAMELSKLVPPKSMATDWAQIVGEVQKFSELSAQIGEYARAGNLSRARPLAKAANRAQQEFTTIAARDGFKQCSIA